ncbi:MAG: Cof-type HAD-IIB family hydrolase [Allobaculum sp.]|nr:Cof-type HAD-IIB family hydrolase [Allobaculum sp.]
MKKKIVFIDMDGTLYQTENDVVQPSSIEAIQTLKDNGFKVYAATGRPLNMLRPILDHVQFDGYVLINGGYTLDQNFNIMDANPIDSQSLADLLTLVQDHKLGLMIHFGDASYIYNNFYPTYEFAKYTNSLDGLFYDPTLSYHKRHPAYNAVVMTKDPGLIQNFMESHPDLRLDLINVKTEGFAYDIFPKENDKTRGIEAVLKQENLSWPEAVTFGDSTNDLGMLEKAGLGIAMGTAKDQVKNAADYVTTSVYDDGIANALNLVLESE